MTVINPKSISGITSITLPSGGDNVLTIHTNDGVERFRVDSSGNVKVGSAATISQDGDVFFTGVCTATTLSGAVAASGLTGAIPVARLTSIPAANIVGVATAGFERSGGFSGGKILQVVQTFLNTAVSLGGVQSYTDISGFTASITPSSASNKILIMLQMNLSTEGEYILKLLRTAAGSTSDVGNSTAGNHTSFTGGFQNTARSGYYDMLDKNLTFLDDAQDTNAHVYKVQWSNITNVNTYLNRTAYSTTTANYSYSGSSSVTLMEVEV